MVQDANAFSKCKDVVLTVDARTATTHMEKKSLPHFQHKAEKEENMTLRQKVTSSEFMGNHGEQLPRGKCSDYEWLILQQIVQSHVAFGEQEPDYDKICQIFLSVMNFTGNTNICTQKISKIRAMIKNIMSKRNFTLALFQREMENCWLN